MTVPDAPSPFQPQPAAPATGGRGGCSKPVFIGCGVLVVVLVIGAILFLANARSIFRWWLGKAETMVTALVPPEVTPEERAALHRGFDDLGRAFTQGGQPDPRYLQQFQTKLVEVLQKPKGQVTRQQILDLTRILELTAGKHPPPQESPPPAAGANPTPPPTPVPKT